MTSPPRGVIPAITPAVEIVSSEGQVGVMDPQKAAFPEAQERTRLWVLQEKLNLL